MTTTTKSMMMSTTTNMVTTERKKTKLPLPPLLLQLHLLLIPTKGLFRLPKPMRSLLRKKKARRVKKKRKIRCLLSHKQLSNRTRLISF